MDWKELTIGQVVEMLQDEKYFDVAKKNYPLDKDYNPDTGEYFSAGTCVSLWDRLRIPLRVANYPAENKKPIYAMMYALVVTVVWHALAQGEKPESIDLPYLEEKYSMKDLFWDSKKEEEAKKKGKNYFVFSQYFGQGSFDSMEIKKSLEDIKADYAQKSFQGDMTFDHLLDKVRQENKIRKPEGIHTLHGVLENWLQNVPEEDLPPKSDAPDGDLLDLEQEPSGKPVPDKGSPKLKEKLNQTFARDVCGLIENGIKQFIFTGAPGTGKTYAAKLLAGYLGELQDVSGKGKPVSYTFVQFHPSYDYTDFVEGLRPIQRDGQISFAKLDGHFKAFCRWVVKQENPNGKYFFIIDEINRAELSKVFGELMYCLEPDKRGEANKINTQYQNLKTYDLESGAELEDDVFSEGFYIPENVYVIGTMNDIDRSVESMDFALRRRFEWIEAKVDKDMLKFAFIAMEFGDNGDKLARRVDALNTVLKKDGAVYGLNRQYSISHGQFANLPASIDKKGSLEKILKYVWNYRLETMLREYLRGVDEAKVEEFVKKCWNAFCPGVPRS